MGRARRPGPPSLPALVLELTAGTLLLGGAALAGALLVRRPWENRLDVWGYTSLPAQPDSRVFHDLAAIGSLPVLLIGIAVAIICSVWRDLPRAAACAIGPIAAVLITEQIAKPLAHRGGAVFGGYSYPSGTVTAAAALATVATLAVPRLLRPVALVVGTAAVLAVSAAVVALRWHYPTDALGGIFVGVGSVLVLDALFHVPGAARRDLRARRAQAGRPGAELRSHAVQRA